MATSRGTITPGNCTYICRRVNPFFALCKRKDLCRVDCKPGIYRIAWQLGWIDDVCRVTYYPGILTDNLRTMAADHETRNRIDLRVTPALRERLQTAADRFGLKISAYIRLAVIERLERDETTEAHGKRRKAES